MPEETLIEEVKQPTPYPVAILANRHKWSESEEEPTNIALIDELLEELQSKHGLGLIVVGLNDDIGFGAILKRACFIKKIQYVTYTCRMDQFPQTDQPKQTYQALTQWFHLGKTAAVIYVCKEFHMFTNRRNNMPLSLMARMNPIEEVINRIRTQPILKWVIYNATNVAIEKSANSPSVG